MLDTNIFLALNGDGGTAMDAVMYVVSNKYIWVPLYAAVLGWIWREKGWKMALLTLVVAAGMVACADMTATFCKNTFPRLRPSHEPALEGLVHTVYGYKGGSYGTVSSHAANSMVFGLISAAILRRRWYTVAIMVWVIVVSYSRIYLGVHYPKDLLFGLVDGTLWFLLWWRGAFLLAKKKFKL